MGLAMPQLYLEVAYATILLTFQLGHFYLPVGYERPIPTESFFYSNSYGFSFSFLKPHRWLGCTRIGSPVMRRSAAAFIAAWTGKTTTTT